MIRGEVSRVDLPTHGLSVCAGIGGIDLGLSLVLPQYHTVCFVERDHKCARILSQHFPAVPIWDDISTFPEFTGRVDIVHGGIPCQPFSVAGRRQGVTDDRWLWPQFWRVVRNVGAEYLFLENTPGITTDGLPLILGDLAQAGWDAEWGLFSAAQVGAPHQRKRFFLLAHRQEQSTRESHHSECAVIWCDARKGTGGAAGDLMYKLWGTPMASMGVKPSAGKRRGTDLSHQAQTHQNGQTLSGNGRDILPLLNPRFVEWLMGLPAGWVEPGEASNYNSWATLWSQRLSHWRL